MKLARRTAAERARNVAASGSSITPRRAAQQGRRAFRANRSACRPPWPTALRARQPGPHW